MLWSFKNQHTVRNRINKKNNCIAALGCVLSKISHNSTTTLPMLADGNECSKGKKEEKVCGYGPFSEIHSLLLYQEISSSVDL